MSIRVLIVEDQADIRRLLRETLALDDYLFSEASDAPSGWELVQHWRPDIVLADIMMPGAFDGLELCRRIKADAQLKQTRVLLVSARGHRHDLDIGRQVGADDYLIKPFSPQRLLERLAALSELQSPAA